MSRFARAVCVMPIVASLSFLAQVAVCETLAPAERTASIEPLHKIALVEVQEPAGFGASNLANEARFLGGALNMQHGEQFTKALRDRGFNFSGELNERLTNALTAAGFEVERIQRIRKENVITHADTAADAILIVDMGVAYVAKNSFADYVPQLRGRVVLLENRTGKESQLYRENFWYGSKNPLIGGIQIDPDPTYSYGTFDKLMERNVEAGEGLLKGATAISERLTHEISPLKH